MRKFTLLVLLLVTGFIMAAPIDREAAMQQAQQFLNKKHPTNARRAIRSATLDRSLREMVSDAYFVFNVGENDGFVIVSGDDRTAPILGYVDRGSFDSATLPDNVKAWLAGYADQLRHLDEITKPAATSQFQRAPRRAKAKYTITPLLETTWDQEAPYNNSCPEFFDLGTSFTGCVATAMAQVMYYHKWPAATTKELPAYTCKTNWSGYGQVSVKAIPAGTTLAWDQMKNSYTANDEDVDACNAVATLMAACGSSVEMNYANNAGGGSTAAVTKAADAMPAYFDYSATIKKVFRDDYSYASWSDMIYTELEAERPVLYGGQSSGGGHAFVVDGYDGEGMFHINWGWGGYCNGYFALSVANPDSSSGAGASDTKDGYSYGQEAVIGIKKQDGETADVGIIQMTTTNFSVDGTTIYAKLYNWTGATYTFDQGFAFIDEQGDLADTQWVVTNVQFGDTQGLVYGITLDVASLGLELGTYRIVPVSKLSSEEYPHCSLNYTKEYALVTVAVNSVTVEIVHSEANLMVSGCTVVGKAKTGVNTQLDIDIQNKGDEFYGELFLCDGSTLMAKVGATLLAGQTTTVSFYYTPVASGTNNLNVTLDEAGTNIIGSISVPVADNGSGSAVLGVTAITYSNGDAKNVYGSFSGVLSVCNSGTADYDGNLLFMTMYSEDHVHFSTLKNTDLEVSLPAGQTVDVPFDINGLGYDYDYLPVIYAGNTQIHFDWADVRALKPGVTIYFANGTKTSFAPTTTFIVDAEAVAVDLTATEVTNVSGGNANTLYLVGETDELPSGITTNVIRDGVAEQLTLSDGVPFSSPIDFTVGHVSFTRTFDKAFADNAGWTTLALPFTVTKVEATVNSKPRQLGWAKDKNDTSKELLVMAFEREDNDVLYFNFVTDFEGYRPYLIGLADKSLVNVPITFSGEDANVKSNFKASVTGEHVSFRSTLQDRELANVYTLDTDGVGFDLRAMTPVSAFSSYIVPVGCDYAKLHIHIPDTTVNVKSVPAVVEKQSGVWYNINGQRVSKPATRGVYIHDGKAVMIK